MAGKRIVTRIGDIFSVTLDNGKLRFFQYIAKDISCLNSPVIRVFKRMYPADYILNTNEVIADEVDFYAHTILRWGITEGFWSKVGKNQNIGDTENIIFRAFIKDDFNNHENRIWEAWYINKEIFPIGKLSKYYRENSDIGLIIPAEAIVGRINTGVFPGTIFNKWEI